MFLGIIPTSLTFRLMNSIISPKQIRAAAVKNGLRNLESSFGSDSL
jgi:hypothetical protein